MLRSPRFYGFLFGLGCLALVLIFWWHSMIPIWDGYLYADLGDDDDSNPVIEICQTLTFLFLFGLYFLALIKWKQWQFKTRDVVLMLVAPSLLAWSALPANSTDIFCYISMGRLPAIYGANPYLHTYSEFGDEYSSYVQWDVTIPYGPVILPFFTMAGWISKYSVVAAVFSLKLVWLLTYYGNCWVLYRILKAWRSDPAYGLFLFALNPLILIEHLANGHNDGMLIFCGLLAIWSLQRGRTYLAVLLALLSALVKLPGIFFLMVVVGYLLWRRDWRGLVRGALAGGALLLALKLTLFPTTESLISLTNPNMDAKNSLKGLLLDLIVRLGGWLESSVEYDSFLAIDRRISAVLLFSFCAWRIWQLGRNLDLNSVVRELAYIYLAVLIGYASWFFPWYVTWLIPLAAMVESTNLRSVIIVYTCSVLALYSFPNYIVEKAPLHWLWATLRILIAQGTPLVLLARGISLEKSREVWRSLETPTDVSKEKAPS